MAVGGVVAVGTVVTAWRDAPPLESTIASTTPATSTAAPAAAARRRSRIVPAGPQRLQLPPLARGRSPERAFDRDPRGERHRLGAVVDGGPRVAEPTRDDLAPRPREQLERLAAERDARKRARRGE